MLAKLKLDKETESLLKSALIAISNQVTEPWDHEDYWYACQFDLQLDIEVIENILHITFRDKRYSIELPNKFTAKCLFLSIINHPTSYTTFMKKVEEDNLHFTEDGKYEIIAYLGETYFKLDLNYES